MLSSLAPARRRVVLGAASLVAVLILAATALFIVDRLAGSGDRTGAAVEPVAEGRSGVVLLVPGYGGARSSLGELASFLRAQGKQVEVVRLVGDGKGDLDAQARLLAADVQALHAPSVDVVGYSAGGVVARLWLRYHGGAALARRVITLGSPHHGTDVAGIAGNIAPNQCPLACRQLERGSQLLNALNRGDETPPGPAYVSIWTDHDDVVLPATRLISTGR